MIKGIFNLFKRKKEKYNFDPNITFNFDEMIKEYKFKIEGAQRDIEKRLEFNISDIERIFAYTAVIEKLESMKNA